MQNSTGIATNGLDITFDYLVSVMAPKKVRYTDKQFANFAELKRDFEHTGYLTINVLYSDSTIFGSPAGNWQFRAWHDACHIIANADFSPQGERNAAKLMREQVWKLNGPSLIDKARWCAIIDAEVIGQGSYYATYGTFPENQRTFVADYLRTQYGFTDFPKSLDNVTIIY